MSCAQGNDAHAHRRTRTGATHVCSPSDTTTHIMAATISCILVSLMHETRDWQLHVLCTRLAAVLHAMFVVMLHVLQVQLVLVCRSSPSTTHPPDMSSSRPTRDMCRVGSHMDRHTHVFQGLVPDTYRRAYRYVRLHACSTAWDLMMRWDYLTCACSVSCAVLCVCDPAV